MAQERNETQTVRAIALQSLKHELELAISLLKEVKDARAIVAMDADVVNSAREAFRHAVEALNRMPQLTAEDMQGVQRLIDEFRSVLAELNH